MQGSVDKNLSAGRPVGKFQLLVGTEKMDGVSACHRAAPEGMNADFVLFPFACIAFPSINETHVMPGIEGIQQQPGRAAGSVFLLIVVGFGKLNVEVWL